VLCGTSWVTTAPLATIACSLIETPGKSMVFGTLLHCTGSKKSADTSLVAYGVCPSTPGSVLSASACSWEFFKKRQFFIMPGEPAGSPYLQKRGPIPATCTAYLSCEKT
jgi:hypothetical protein